MSYVDKARAELDISVATFLKCKFFASKVVHALKPARDVLAVTRRRFEDALKDLNKSHHLEIQMRRHGLQTFGFPSILDFLVRK